MYNRNKGSVLAISLVILTAITLISVFALERSGLQAKIVRNFQHTEMLFNSTLNEQEYWTARLRKGDAYLFEPELNRVLDEKNNATYFPVILPVMIEDLDAINLTNGLIFVPPVVGGFSLAEGQEANDRVNNQLELNTTARLAARNTPSIQTTGISFIGINTSRNSPTSIN